jgi:hypothetical protein
VPSRQSPEGCYNSSMDGQKRLCPHCNATIVVTGSICPLCGNYLQPVDDTSKATIHEVGEVSSHSPYAWVSKCLVAIVGIILGVTVSVGVCFYWFIINTGVTLGPNGTTPFLFATISIFAVSFIFSVSIWFKAFSIWPFKGR